MLPKEMMVESFDESEITTIYGSATHEIEMPLVPIPPADLIFTEDISTQAKFALISEAMESIRLSPKEKHGSYMFTLIRCGEAK